MRIVKLPPRRERYDVLAAGEKLRQSFEERLNAREPAEVERLLEAGADRVLCGVRIVGDHALAADRVKRRATVSLRAGRFTPRHISVPLGAKVTWRFADATHIDYHINDGRSLDMIEDRSVDFAFS